MLYASHDLHESMNKQKAIDSAVSDFFDAFLDSTFENMARHMSQAVTVLQQYLKVVHIFSYHANRKRGLWKRKESGQLEKAMGKANQLFFHGAKSLCKYVVIGSPTVNCRSGRKRSLPEKTIYRNI